jgi:hypothetical protein
MTRKLRYPAAALALCALVSAGGLAASASAQKGVLGVGAPLDTGVTDIAAPAGGLRYTSLPAGSGTLVSALSLDDGHVDSFTYLDRRLVVPAVAYDGSAGGLSADGETLVLAEPGVRFPRRESAFTVLDTEKLAVVEELTFEGTYTYDAISPDGRSLYLIEYTSPRDLTEYLVREYDLARERFNPKPILDPEEDSEEMYGTPVTRATSPDGRWAYTLYDGREHPFIHALDTVDGAAVCIDLETLHRIRYGAADLIPSVDGATLTVVDRSRPVEIVDTETFEVEPAEQATGTPTEPELESTDAGDEGGWVGWAAIGGGLAALAATLLFIPRHRRLDKKGADQRE